MISTRFSRLFLLLALTLPLQAWAAGKWTWQNNPPPILTKVFFLNSEKGWALGVLGTVARTTNGGASWTGTSINLSTSDLLSVFFVNETTGWIAGEDGALFKSTDGGVNWAPQNSGQIGSLNGIYFINPDTGWIAGGGFLLRTFNGGATWTASSSAAAMNMAFHAVHFRNNGTGWAAGGDIRKSTDYGVTWNTVDTLPTTSIQRALSFANADTGWSAGDDGTILKTTNAGTAWVLQASGTEEEILALRALSPQGAAAIDYNGDLFKTANGGSAWAKTHAPDIFTTRAAAALWNADTAWAVDQAGAIFRTTNGGANWPLQGEARCDRQCDLQSVFFADTSTGWAVGDSGVIVKTTNGGGVWARQASGVKTFLKAVHFAHPDTGWVAGRAGTILKSINGGGAWAAQNSGTAQDLTGVHFLNGSLGWAVGAAGIVLKTTNGGTAWSPQTQGTAALAAVQFLDASRGWMAGANGTVYKTVNGGNNWSPQTTGTTADLSGLHFLDTLSGWASGPGILLKTTDGGTSWAEAAAGGSRYVQFLDYRNGWATDKTTDGGATWVTQPTLPVGTSGGFATQGPVGGDAFFADINHGWAVGFRGSILRYSDNAAPSAPVPATPVHNAPNIALGSALAWRAASSATAYRLQLSADSTFASTIVDDSALTGLTRTTGTLGAGTGFYWRVRAKNAFGSSGWSEVFRFSTVPNTPPAPGLASPANGASGLGPTQTLTWNASAGAATYRVQLATDSLFNTLLLNDSTVTTTSRAAPSLATGTSYYWRVNARNAGGTSAYSPIWRFSTIPTALAPSDFAFRRTGMSGGRAFQFGLPYRARVRIVLFDAKGVTARKLLDEEREAGYYTLPLSAELLEGSYYLLDFRAGTYRKTFRVRL